MTKLKTVHAPHLGASDVGIFLRQSSSDDWINWIHLEWAFACVKQIGLALHFMQGKWRATICLNTLQRSFFNPEQSPTILYLFLLGLELSIEYLVADGVWDYQVSPSSLKMVYRSALENFCQVIRVFLLYFKYGFDDLRANLDWLIFPLVNFWCFEIGFEVVWL